MKRKIAFFCTILSISLFLQTAHAELCGRPFPERIEAEVAPVFEFDLTQCSNDELREIEGRVAHHLEEYSKLGRHISEKHDKISMLGELLARVKRLKVARDIR